MDCTVHFAISVSGRKDDGSEIQGIGVGGGPNEKTMTGCVAQTRNRTKLAVLVGCGGS